ncbi:hypothetical protein NTGBS_770022 [Candidatus Nitrotoga sp. BS]|nr:hypothetical protein NTGBS_770022 [Candidatus Nitrotoga sp. BS]
MHIITCKSQQQLTLNDFETHLEVKLDAEKRWVNLVVLVSMTQIVVRR